MFRGWKSKFAGIIFVLSAVLFLVLEYSTETLAFSEVKQNSQSWGYKIVKKRFGVETEINIWNTRGSKFIYYGSGLSVKVINQEKWLSNQRIILLDLDLAVMEDSIMPIYPTKILFDYDRGEIYVLSTINLWRNGERDIQQGYNWVNKAWITEEEFQEVLERIGE